MRIAVSALAALFIVTPLAFGFELTEEQKGPAISARAEDGCEHLKPFSELIGTWCYKGPLHEGLQEIGEAGDEGTGCITWKWVYDKNAIEWEWKFDFGGKKTGTKGLIMWDAATKRIVGHGVGSAGQNIHVQAEVKDGVRFAVESVAGDGKRTTHTETYVRDGACLVHHNKNRAESPDIGPIRFRKVCEPSDAEKVFKSYMDLAVGGVWTTTIDGEQLEHTYRWVRGKKFVQLKGRGGILPYIAMIGIDPKTKKCTWWIYNEDGSMGIDSMTQEKEGVWLLEGPGTGQKGNIRYKGRISRLDKDTIEEEVIEFVAYGQVVGPSKHIWKRKRP